MTVKWVKVSGAHCEACRRQQDSPFPFLFAVPPWSVQWLRLPHLEADRRGLTAQFCCIPVLWPQTGDLALLYFLGISNVSAWHLVSAHKRQLLLSDSPNRKQPSATPSLDRGRPRSGSGRPSPEWRAGCLSPLAGTAGAQTRALRLDLLCAEAVSSVCPLLWGEICLLCERSAGADLCYPSWVCRRSLSLSRAGVWNAQALSSAPCSPRCSPLTGSVRNQGLCAKPFTWGLYFSFLFMPEATSWVCLLEVRLLKAFS